MNPLQKFGGKNFIFHPISKATKSPPVSGGEISGAMTRMHYKKILGIVYIIYAFFYLTNLVYATATVTPISSTDIAKQGSDIIGLSGLNIFAMSSLLAGVSFGISMLMKSFAMGRQEAIEEANKIIRFTITGWLLVNSAILCLNFLNQTETFKNISSFTRGVPPSPIPKTTEELLSDHGLTTTYFINVVDNGIDFDWQNAAPSLKNRTKTRISVQWQGSLSPYYTDVPYRYVFGLTSVDGIGRLSISDSAGDVLTHFKAVGFNFSNPILLDPAERYYIHMNFDMYTLTTSTKAQLYWAASYTTTLLNKYCYTSSTSSITPTPFVTQSPGGIYMSPDVYTIIPQANLWTLKSSYAQGYTDSNSSFQRCAIFNTQNYIGSYQKRFINIFNNTEESFTINNTTYSDYFSIKFYGYLVPDETAYYYFNTSSDDDMTLYLYDYNSDGYNGTGDGHNDELFSLGTSVSTSTSKKILLYKGKYYPMRANYYEKTGSANFNIRWGTDGTNFYKIPSSCLYN